MRIIDLDKDWRLRSEDLAVEHSNHALVSAREEGWHSADLPCDVRMPLIRDGVIAEPLEKLNCFDSEWIEGKAWWFTKKFDLEIGSDDRAAELVLDYLDYGAAIYLNGAFLGEHGSVFYPFRAEVKRFLKRTGNTLTIRLSAGADRISDAAQGDFRNAASHESTNGRPDRGERKRVFLRKPQYVFGWDWGPRIATVGIGDARVELKGVLEVEAVSVRVLTPLVEGIGEASIQVEAEIDNREPLSTREAKLLIGVTDPSGRLVAEARSSVFLRSGLNMQSANLSVASPQLWWPNGYGDQPLYSVRATLVGPEGGGGESKEVVTKFAFRTLELDQSPIPELGPGHRKFAFRVNGADVFCKGSNWIPADSIYERVTDEKYRALVAEAAAARFTMLRVWGGGIYEKEAFYRACDEAGILVWQDLMFGCGFYPDRDERFLDLVRKELDYQLRRLRAHPCIALICGNNENHWALDTAWFSGREPYFGGETIWNRLAPRMLASIAPELPYWNSSPYGGARPNDVEAGDRHHWREATMNADMEKRIEPEAYDLDLGKFVSEYGYIGPCVKSTIARYFADEPVVTGSPIWNHHNNAFEKETVSAGIVKHYRDPTGFSLDEYLLYAGLVQSLMYGYSLESIRASENSGGGLFWMFADCWGEVGWTIVDYYLKRKAAFYAVRRAFAPVKLVLRKREGRVVCIGMNDTKSDLVVPVRHGYFRLDDGKERSKTAELHLAARSRRVVLSFEAERTDPSAETAFVRPAEAYAAGAPHPEILPATLRETEFKNLSVADPILEVRDVESAEGGLAATVRAERWAHAVHFDLGDAVLPSDEWFDLLPGEERRIVFAGLDAKEARRLIPKSVR